MAGARDFEKIGIGQQIIFEQAVFFARFRITHAQHQNLLAVVAKLFAFDIMHLFLYGGGADDQTDGSRKLKYHQRLAQP
ncbi:MAG: hypothetical protein ALAOOOJD_03491 [bacterium]|nr:hypothetical protein [bacterium]